MVEYEGIMTVKDDIMVGILTETPSAWEVLNIHIDWCTIPS